MSVFRRWRGFVRWLKSLNTTRLKRVGVVTYFGVYALLFFGIHRVMNRLLLELPSVVRPPLLDPVWVVIDLPRSLATGTFSLGVTALVLGAMVIKSAWTTLSGSGDTSYVHTPYELSEDSDAEPDETAEGEEDTVNRNESWVGDYHRVVDRDYARDERRNYRGGRPEVPRRGKSPSRTLHQNRPGAPHQNQSGEFQSETDAADEDSWPEEWVSGDEL